MVDPESLSVCEAICPAVPCARLLCVTEVKFGHRSLPDRLLVLPQTAKQPTSPATRAVRHRCFGLEAAIINMRHHGSQDRKVVPTVVPGQQHHVVKHAILHCPCPRLRPLQQFSMSFDAPFPRLFL
jgi:hypothetical protein